MHHFFSLEFHYTRIDGVRGGGGHVTWVEQLDESVRDEPEAPSHREVMHRSLDTFLDQIAHDPYHQGSNSEFKVRFQRSLYRNE
jgi:hypothetical protein